MILFPEQSKRITSLNQHRSKGKISSPIPTFKNQIFNSKLFIALDSNFSQEDSTSSEDETYKNIENDINNKGCYLNKELIEELDSPNILEDDEDKKDFDQNLVLSLVNNGYEYIPKKYQFQQKKMNKNNKVKNNFNCNQQKAKKVIKERKGDWVCQFCCNINFAFRMICNRCKGRKEECLQTIIM